MKQLQQIHNIVSSGFKVAKIETDRYDDIINLFHQYSAQSGKPLFLWQQGAGINRLSGKQMLMDNTRLLTEAIDFIETAPDFGVYILKDFPEKYPDRISHLQFYNQSIRFQPAILNRHRVVYGKD